MPNYEDIYGEMIIDDADSLTSAIGPLQNEILVIKGVDAGNEGVDSENYEVVNDRVVTVNSNSLPTSQKVCIL